MATDAINLVEILKAVSDETRLRILHLIDQRGPELCVCDLTAALNLPQSTVSRQLMRLRHLGLVADRRDGMWINYRLRTGGSIAREAVLECLQKCWSASPMFERDCAHFDKLISEDRIVRCKRGEAVLKNKFAAAAN